MAKFIFNPLTGLIDTYKTVAGIILGSSVSVDTTNFNNNLSSADDTVQKALDTLDNLGQDNLEELVYVGDVLIESHTLVAESQTELTTVNLTRGE
jgi:hypothetical protein